ncbi:glycosyltransferase family 2 protein [Magnetovibrio sp.]|uniref:glycosyltransferase family 2 protein n=1 Tax=Magnetovibrio sp. TaxID=2024836 RepID=UPI002F951CF4
MASVTILLSNYNHEKYLPDSLWHICNQTRPADEIIIVDDGSHDNSLDVIYEFKKQFPHIKVIENGENLGLQETITRTLGLVETDYLVWAASDDRLLPNFLERSMAVLERHPEAGLAFSETSVLLGDTEEIDRFAINPSVKWIFNLSDLPEFLSGDALRKRMQSAYLPIASNSSVINVEFLRALGGFPKALEWHSDWFMVYALSMIHGCCIVPETLALIRSNPDSYSDNMRDGEAQKKVLLSMLAILRRKEFAIPRSYFRACPSNLSPFGVLMLKILATRPLDWDLFIPYFIWKTKEYKRGHGLTWGTTFKNFVKRALKIT